MLCFFCSSLFWRGGRGGGGGSDAVSNPFLGDEHATVMQCITLCPCYHQQIHERSNKEQLCLCEQWIGPLLVFWWSLFLSPSLSPKSSILQWHAMWTINWTFTCVLMICLPLSLSLQTDLQSCSDVQCEQRTGRSNWTISHNPLSCSDLTACARAIRLSTNQNLTLNCKNRRGDTIRLLTLKKIFFNPVCVAIRKTNVYGRTGRCLVKNGKPHFCSFSR